MPYFTELPDEIQDEIVNILSATVKKDKDHRMAARDVGVPFGDYINEVVDDWLNRNNYNLSYDEWIEQAYSADI